MRVNDEKLFCYKNRMKTKLLASVCVYPRVSKNKNKKGEMCVAISTREQRLFTIHSFVWPSHWPSHWPGNGLCKTFLGNECEKKNFINNYSHHLPRVVQHFHNCEVISTSKLIVWLQTLQSSSQLRANQTIMSQTKKTIIFYRFVWTFSSFAWHLHPLALMQTARMRI